MEFITNALESIMSVIDTVFGFFESLIANIMMLFEYIALASTTAYNFIATLPTWLQAFGTATILISVLYMILGRESGGRKSE